MGVAKPIHEEWVNGQVKDELEQIACAGPNLIDRYRDQDENTQAFPRNAATSHATESSKAMQQMQPSQSSTTQLIECEQPLVTHTPLTFSAVSRSVKSLASTQHWAYSDPVLPPARSAAGRHRDS